VRTNNDILKTISPLFVFFCLISFTLKGQPGASAVTHPKYPVDSGEKISLFTDRSIYCVKEKMYFTAEYSCIEELASLSWSTVLYVELIRWNGTRIAGSKLRLTGKTTSASLEIPGNIPSGNYYLRAYTRWMRNYPPGEYAYTGIKIVNPFRPDTDDGPADSETSAGINTLNFIQKSLVNGISCVTDKEEYKSGETAEIKIEINSKNPVDFDSYCISVTKAGITDTTDSFIESAQDFTGDLPAYIEYLPEIRGITISGQVADRSDGLPLKDVPVSLSETQSGDYYATYTTDERGRFVFSLPDMEKQHDFFVQTEIPSGINIDNGYCNRPVRLPYIAFDMNVDETDFVREVMVNQQITDKFKREKDLLKDSPQEKSSPLVFYGSKKSVYFTNKYIELPDVREFIFEIIPEASIISDKEKTSLISIRRPDNRYYPPLVFLDNIRVDGSEQLLKIPLSRIERVEVINTDYLVGNIQYYGILSFYSVNRDFAGLELNKNSLFFSYDLFSETLPGFEFSNTTADQNTPDRRNLLYWNPDIRLPAGEKASVSFNTSDCTGDYVVFIRSKNQPDQDGIYGKCPFTVR
jgi:hypothetical protein